MFNKKTLKGGESMNYSSSKTFFFPNKVKLRRKKIEHIIKKINE